LFSRSLRQGDLSPTCASIWLKIGWTGGICKQLHQSPPATTSASLKRPVLRARRSEETPYQGPGLEDHAKEVMSAALLPAFRLPVGAEGAAGRLILAYLDGLPGNDARWTGFWSDLCSGSGRTSGRRLRSCVAHDGVCCEGREVGGGNNTCLTCMCGVAR
jgi:hypothetical protein